MRAHAAAPKKVVRILVADDHEVVRQGLRALLESRRGWRVVAEVLDGETTVEETKRLRPDVVLVDFSIPGLNGVETTRRIRSALPDTQVLMLAVHASPELGREALEAGASGCLLKCDAGGRLVCAVETLVSRKPIAAPPEARTPHEDAPLESLGGGDGTIRGRTHSRSKPAGRDRTIRPAR